VWAHKRYNENKVGDQNHDGPRSTLGWGDLTGLRRIKENVFVQFPMAERLVRTKLRRGGWGVRQEGKSRHCLRGQQNRQIK